MKKLYLVAVLMMASSMVFADVMPDEEEYEKANMTEVCVGQDVIFNLISNKTTGYEWQLAEPVDKNILELAGSKYVPEATDRVGAGGKEIWTFKTIGTGKTTVSFKYVRPWEKETEPARTASFTVMVKEAPQPKKEAAIRMAEPNLLKGTVESIEFSDLFTRPNPNIIVVDEKGERVIFVVKPAAAICDDKGKLITLRDINAGDKVEINYRTKGKNINEAVIIKSITAAEISKTEITEK